MMKNLIPITFAAFACLVVAPPATADSVEQFNAAFTEANDLRKKSGEVAHEWRDTAKILKSAQAAAEEGDFEKAMKLVAEAKFQSNAAIAQADRESRLWEGRVVR